MEDTEIDDLVRQVGGILFTVPLADTQQNDKSGPYGSYLLSTVAEAFATRWTRARTA